MEISRELIEDIKTIDTEMRSESNVERVEHNETLLEIVEGNLKPYVLKALKEQLSPNAFKQASFRLVLVNVLKKLIDKLSQCFSKPPVRMVYDTTDQVAGDEVQKLLQWYESEMKMNEAGATGNEYMNLSKNCAFEPYLDDEKPSLRVLPADRIYPYSKDKANPLRVTHFVKVMGKVKDGAGNEKTLNFIYTDTEIAAFYSGGEVAYQEMAAREMDGSNPYGAIPFVYLARSKVHLIPKIDSDTLAMTILIPILLTDLAYAMMFLCFGMVWVKDGTIVGEQAPNATLQLKSDPNHGGSGVEIGSIKPEIESDKALAMIKTIITLWLETRNIKPGAMGEMTVQNYASGISKFLDEMDTSADRQKQVPYLKAADEALCNLILNHMHPVWMSRDGFKKPVRIPRDLAVKSTFSEQRPMIDESQALADQEKKIAIGLQSKRGALAELHPDWTDKQIDQRLKEIEAEKKRAVAEAQSMMGEESQDDEEGPLAAKEPAQETEETQIAS